VLGNGTVHVHAVFDTRTDKQQLRIERNVHGNTKVSVIDADFVHGADYTALAFAAQTFNGLVGQGARISRGTGEKRKEASITDFREAMTWLLNEAQRGVSTQRYKGLGEMNPSQLWETTMDPQVRRLLKVQIEDAIGADQIFTTLMGDEVEPRREFIEKHALQASVDV
jgi:DNA gyrase subunit B